jgi:hypothetical protein
VEGPAGASGCPFQMKRRDGALMREARRARRNSLSQFGLRQIRRASRPSQPPGHT